MRVNIILDLGDLGEHYAEVDFDADPDAPHYYRTNSVILEDFGIDITKVVADNMIKDKVINAYKEMQSQP